MKKIVSLVIFLSIFMVLSLAIAGLNKPYTLLDAATATGPGEPEVIVDAFNEWGCDVTVFGNASTVTVVFEGNQGGSEYDPEGWAIKTLDTAEIAAGFAQFGVSSPPLKKIRGNLTVLTGGTAPDVTLLCVGKDQ